MKRNYLKYCISVSIIKELNNTDKQKSYIDKLNL